MSLVKGIHHVALKCSNAQELLQKAIKADDDTAELTNAFEKFQDSDSLIDMMQLRSLVSAYHPVDVSDQATWMAII
jgi:hypothetical protein